MSASYAADMARHRGGRPRESDRSAFGERFNEILERAIGEGRFRSRAHFLRELGMEASQFARYENGAVEVRLDVVQRVAKLLDVSPAALLDASIADQREDDYPAFLEFAELPEARALGTAILRRLQAIRFHTSDPPTVQRYRSLASEYLLEERSGSKITPLPPAKVRPGRIPLKKR